MFMFHIPVAALEKQQQRLEILGENIANINTPGYKMKQMSFVEALGTVSGVTQMLFKQGAINYTGNPTDMAIDGNSFFIIRAGDEQVYSRAGSFQINEQGKLVTVNGDSVQGWMQAGFATGTKQNGNQLNDIIIDSNLILPPQPTENVWFSGNLNAGLNSVTEVWASGCQYLEKATLLGSAFSTPISIMAGSNDQLQINIKPNYDTQVAEQITLTAGTYNSADAIVAEINNQIAANNELNGRVEALNVNGAIKFRVMDGFSGTGLSVVSGTNDALAVLGFQSGASAVSGGIATADTDINDLLQTYTDLAVSDSFHITGTLADNSSVDGNFVYGTEDGVTLGDLVDKINNLYTGGSTAEIVDGKIVVTDDISGDSSSSISLTAADGNAGEISFPGFALVDEGYQGKISTSIIIYDSLGKSHNIGIDFLKSEDQGTWLWSATCGDDSTIIKGGSGRVIFDPDGSLASFVFDGGADAIVLDSENGAAEMKVNLHCEATDGFIGLSQFESVSTLQGREQDGRKSEILSGFSIDNDGKIFGSFGTGEQIQLAQIALAKFRNPMGLEKIGEGYFKDTAESGIAHISTASSQGSVLESNSLELSTVDLADQFTKMIEAQRAYQAASKVINTFEEIFDETSRLKR